MAEPIISVSGLRGIIGTTLTPQVAIRYAAAFGSTLAGGPILIARDGRPSGKMLAGALHAGLNAVGRDTIEAGVCATPTVGILARTRRCAGAIQITASHNPSQYNGLKLISAEGRVIPAGPGQKVLDAYRTEEPAWVLHDMLGTRAECDDTTSDHLNAVLDTVDTERIRSKNYRVLLDSNHGSGGTLGRLLLESLGCEVVILGEAPTGGFLHTPEPTAENLASVCASIPKEDAAVGFCQDPDADRLALIDENGRYVGEEYTLAVILNSVLAQSPGPVVINCGTSRMSEDIAQKYGQTLTRSAVGEPNVVDTMIATQAVFGGEGNGGPIDPSVGYIRDSFVGMARVLDAMAARDEAISTLVDELPSYDIVKTKISLEKDRIPAALDALEAKFSDATADRMDGLRLDWSDAWLLVRGSNTEPIVRAIAEAPSRDRAEKLCEEAAGVIGAL